LAASLGIAGLGALASLAVYRDYFIVLAVLTLGYSFFATFQKKYKAGRLNLRNYRFGRDDILLLVTTVLVVLAISFPYIRGVTLAQSGASYDGRGLVVSVDAKGKKIALKHEEIKGLMPAMTMEFPVKSTDILKGIREGDKVRFTLIPQGADFVVEKIQNEE
jgi:Cu/Ag efflux protein CusF